MTLELYRWTKRRHSTEAIIVHSISKAVTAHDMDIRHRRAGYYCCGFHYCIDPDGVTPTRHHETIGHHLPGWDNHSIAVAILGYDGKSPIPEDLAASATEIILELRQRYQVSAVAAPQLLAIEGYDPLLTFVRETNEHPAGK